MRHICFSLTLALYLVGCASSINIGSRWGNNDVQQTEQRGIYVKDQNIVVDVLNDNEYLYLTVGVSDRIKQRQVAFQGLTIWFDYQGGDEKRFGIHYPVRAERPQYEGGQPDPERMRDTSWTFPENFSDELEILGPMEGEHHRMHMVEAKGIDAKIQNNSGTLVYSLKVPLLDNGQHSYAIGAKAGTAIGIGIETGTFIQGERGGVPRGGGGRGGRGGFGGRGRGGEGMPSEEFRASREPIKFWAKVQLASQ
jgi:hypothetical protein